MQNNLHQTLVPDRTPFITQVGKPDDHEMLRYHSPLFMSLNFKVKWKSAGHMKCDIKNENRV